MRRGGSPVGSTVTENASSTAGCCKSDTDSKVRSDVGRAVPTRTKTRTIAMNNVPCFECLTIEPSGKG